MMQSTQVTAKYPYGLVALLLIMLLASACAYAGVATYQLDGGTSVPAPISYWLSGDATSVTIDIIDATTGAVVYTFPTLTGAQAAKGYHSGVVTWTGESNGGGTAPQGPYKVRATVVSDMSGAKLKPIWESCSADGTDSNGWRIYGIAMNCNPSSPFYGRVYVGNYQNSGGKTRGIWEFNPDGSLVGLLPQPVGGFGVSGPWGLCVDADDHVYVSNRSDSYPNGGAGHVVWRYHWDSAASQWVCEQPVTGISYDRYLGCNYASGSALRLVDTYYTGSGSTALSRLYTGSGDPPASFAQVGGNKNTGDCFMQPAVDASGTIFAAGINWTNYAPTAVIGALTQWDSLGNAKNDSVTGSNRNGNVTQVTGVAISIDDSTMWLARQGRNALHSFDGVETTDFYRFPKDQAMRVTPTSVDLAKYGWGTVYKASSQYPRFIAVDGLSNVAVGGVDSDIASPGSVFGLYGEPTGAQTTEVRVGRNTITWGNDYAPELVSASVDPSTVKCGGSTTLSVIAKDENSQPLGLNDIDRCVFLCPALGYGTDGDPATGVAMALLSGPDANKQNEYELSINVPAEAPTGPIVADIYVYDVGEGVTPAHSTVTINVIGGTIAGSITEGVTGRPAAGVTIRATKGAFYREAVTGADGAYSINVTPGAGYTVAPVLNDYKNTVPTEYNLQSNWPADPGATDWPKSADVALDGSVGVNGRVWPLAVAQATYDWTAHAYRSGGRTVCVTGTVLRQAADATAAPVQRGYNGYYFITDTLGGASHDTQQAVKVKVFSTGSECRNQDRVVVVGTLDPPVHYSQGVVTPTSAPAVISGGNPLPNARDATNFINATLYGNLIGGYYVMRGKTVTRIGTDGEFYVLTGGNDPVEFRIDMNSMESTGISYPQVGQVLDIYGVLDEMGPWNGLRAIRPGSPADLVVPGAVDGIPAAKSKADTTPVALANAQITAVAGGGLAAGVAYIEQPNRTSALRIQAADLPADIGPGDWVAVQGRMATTAQGERYLDASYVHRNSSARPVDALGMNNRDAASSKALGLFVKIWGKVTASTADSFTITDGSRVAIKVMSGTLAQPEVGRYVRVRGIVSKDSSGPVLLMRNEQVDWAYGEATCQPLPFPGAYKYPRDFLVLGPFADASSTPPEAPGDPTPAQTYRLDHDFIYDATGGANSEYAMTDLKPRLGGAVGGKVWRRSQSQGDNADFTAVLGSSDNYCTYYAHLWVYSPVYIDAAMRVGSADSVKVIVNGMEVWRNQVSASGAPPSTQRTEMQGSDELTWIPLYAGFTSVLLKVEHSTGPCSVDCQFVDAYNMGVQGWGKATPLTGLGYLLDSQP